MIRIGPPLAFLLAAAVSAGAQTGFPFQSESLHYSVNWPSGLSLGDVTLSAHRSGQGWNLEMTVDAGIPGFAVADRFRSQTTMDECSLEFERATAHGSKKAEETTTFDYAKRVARRTTLHGGTTEAPISSCARDALAFVYFTRRELGQGRVPQPQTVFFGAGYSVHLEYTGAQTIPSGEKPAVTDRIVVAVTGPASTSTFEILFARDPARTPLLVRIPLSVGTISLELAR